MVYFLCDRFKKKRIITLYAGYIGNKNGGITMHTMETIGIIVLIEPEGKIISCNAINSNTGVLTMSRNLQEQVKTKIQINTQIEQNNCRMKSARILV